MNAWTTIVEAVDIETGEVITQKQVKEGKYTIKKKTITYEKAIPKNKKLVRWECERNKQTRIQF